MNHTRTRELNPAARPVAVPDDFDDASVPKASGEIGPPLTYDLNDRADRARVYEQVLREGTEDDVRYYVDPDRLCDLFDELVLPPPVRRAWANWPLRYATRTV